MCDILRSGKWIIVEYEFDDANSNTIAIWAVHQDQSFFDYYNKSEKIWLYGNLNHTYKKMSKIQRLEFIGCIENEFKITISETNID